MKQNKLCEGWALTCFFDKVAANLVEGDFEEDRMVKKARDRAGGLRS